MTIHVTQKHIDIGARHNCRFCPVVRATKEATGIDDVRTFAFDIEFYPHSHNRFVAQMPLEVINFIDAFDAGYDVEPFGFDLEVPVP